MKTNNIKSNLRTRIRRIAMLLVAFFGSTITAFAAEPPGADAYSLEGTSGLLKWLLGCMVAIMLILVYIALIMTSKNPAEIIPNFLKSFTGADQANVTMDHEYDGITELDNRMPSWLRLLFWGTIVFAGVYLLHYLVLGTGKLQAEEYAAELAYAEENYKDVEIPEDKLIAFTDPASLAAGKETFNTLCASCHMEDGGGKTGPNLTDAYWKHGGGIKNVYSTITNGVPQAGMISWKGQLTSMQRLQVASYVLEFEGTTPDDPKDPEGDLWTEDGAATTEAAPEADTNSETDPAAEADTETEAETEEGEPAEAATETPEAESETPE